MVTNLVLRDHRQWKEILMADLTLGGFNAAPVFVDKRRARGLTGADPVTEAANMATISSLKARLTALAPSSYTAARMNTMTRNDLIYALRKASSDNAGI